MPAADASKRYRRYLLLAAKAAVTGVLLAWLFSRTDTDQLGESLARAHPGYLVLALCTHFAGFLIGGMRWWLILRRLAPTTLLRSVLPSYFLGLFFNNFLPSSMGGDAVRVLHLRLSGLSTQALIGSSLMDRAIGLFAVLCMTTAAAFFLPPDYLPPMLVPILLAVTLGAAGILWLLSLRATASILEHLTRAHAQTRIRRWLLEIAALCHISAHTRRAIFAPLLLGFVTQSLVILSYYLLAVGLGINVSLALFFVIVPLTFIAASLPLSLGGLGIREGVFVSLLTANGVDAHSAVAISILYLIVLLGTSLPGSLTLLLPARAQEEPRP